MPSPLRSSSRAARIRTLLDSVGETRGSAHRRRLVLEDTVALTGAVCALVHVYLDGQPVFYLQSEFEPGRAVWKPPPAGARELEGCGTTARALALPGSLVSVSGLDLTPRAELEREVGMQTAVIALGLYDCLYSKRSFAGGTELILLFRALGDRARFGDAEVATVNLLHRHLLFAGLTPGHDRELAATLAPRDRAVLELVVAGAPSKQIADRLGVSCSLVAMIMTRLYRTFDVRNRGELVARFLSGRTSAVSSGLSPMLAQTLQHLARGASEREIAMALALSPHTVHDHVRALHRRFRVTSRGELVAAAAKRGFI